MHTGVTINTTSALETVLAFLGPPAGVAVGAVIGIFATRRTSREAATRAELQMRRLDLQRALARYMAATELVAAVLSELPAASWFERQVDRVPRRRIGFFMNSMLARMMFGSRLDDLRAQYQQARAEVVLLGPIEMIGLTNMVDEFFMEWGADQRPEFVFRWAELRDEIRLRLQRTVDEGRGRPYRAGDEPTNLDPRPQPGRRVIGGQWYGIFDERWPKAAP